jgi:hypothetical protein
MTDSTTPGEQVRLALLDAGRRPPLPSPRGLQGIPGDAREGVYRRPVRPVRKAMFFGKSKSTSGTTRAIVQGLREQGVQVEWTNCALLRRWLGERWMRAWVRRKFERFAPDAVVSFFCDVPSDLFAELHAGCRTAIWNEECVVPLDPGLRAWMEHCDVLCLNNTAQIDDYHALGAAQVEFVMSGYSPQVHRPVDLAGLSAPEPRGQLYDLVFIGSPGHGEHRAEMVMSLAERFDVHVFGRGWDRWRKSSAKLHLHGAARPADFARICAQARIVLGMNWINSVPFYFSNRTWMTLGCGGFHLTHYVPGLEQVFGQGEHLVWFREFGELKDLAERFLREPRLRQKIARAGHEFVRARHTYAHRMAHLLDLVAAAPTPADRAVGAAGIAPANGAAAANGTPTNGTPVNGSPNGTPAPIFAMRDRTAPPPSVRVRPDAAQ